MDTLLMVARACPRKFSNDWETLERPCSLKRILRKRSHLATFRDTPLTGPCDDNRQAGFFTDRRTGDDSAALLSRTAFDCCNFRFASHSSSVFNDSKILFPSAPRLGNRY